MATKRKLYTAKSISGAQSRVRQLERLYRELNEIAERYYQERNQLAKLAADGPAFYSPLHIAEAKVVRDRVLKSLHLKPDGSPINA